MKKDYSFEKNSLIIFVLMQMANVCNYLFQIITGKMMAVDDYAILNTLVSIYVMFTIPNTAIGLICAKLFAETNNDEDKKSVIKTLILLVVTVIVLIVIIGIIIMPILNKGFGINNYGYIILVIIAAITSNIYYLGYGIFQGKQNFIGMGIQNFISTFLKFILTVIFLILGMRIFGALLGIIIGTLVAMIYGLIPLKQDIREALKRAERKKIPNFAKFIVLNFISQGCIIAYTNGDILLVKSFFNTTQVGIYSSASVLGKIAMYVSTAVVATLFPLVVTKKKLGEKTVGLFIKALIYGGGASVLCSLFMITFGKTLIVIMFGSRYAAAVDYLLSVCIYVVPLTFNVILMNYLIALDKLKHFSISNIIGIILIVSITYFYHTGIMQVMVVVGSILSIIFIYNMVVLIMQSKTSIN